MRSLPGRAMATTSESNVLRPAGGVTNWLVGLVANLGAFAMGWVAGVGDVTVFASRPSAGWYRGGSGGTC